MDSPASLPLLPYTLAADARFSRPQYTNDIIWELSSAGEPPALALQTTFGLRARSMRVFLRFAGRGRRVTALSEYAVPPRVAVSLPNYLRLTFAALPGVEVEAEYWVPDSTVLAGRVRLTNRNPLPESFQLELAGQLIPFERGTGMAVEKAGINTILSGQSGGLAVVLFLTGGPEDAKTPLPALSLPTELGLGASRQISWALAALPEREDAFQLARKTTARVWEAETARLEVQHQAQTLVIETGNSKWDAALSLAQRTAFSLFFPGGEHLPQPSFVSSRLMDQGFSPRGSGSDYPYTWSGQTALDSWHLAQTLRWTAPELARGLVENFLAAEDESGQVDFRPGLGGQRARMLATPLLASLAWDCGESDPVWLRKVYPGLLNFIKTWLLPRRDRDNDGWPEWDHPAQTGLEDAPIYDRWHPGAQGVEITTLEAPSLAALLCRELSMLRLIALHCGLQADLGWLEQQAEKLKRALRPAWNKAAGGYLYRDFFVHQSPPGKLLRTWGHDGADRFHRSIPPPHRLLLQISCQAERTPEVFVQVRGQTARGLVNEEIGPRQWSLDNGFGRATLQAQFFSIERVEVRGLMDGDALSLAVVDYTMPDLSTFLPLWAGIPERAQAERMAADLESRYRLQDGLALAPELPGLPQRLAPPAWQALIGEALLAAGFRAQAARLAADLLNAVRLEERSAQTLAGMAPLGLFLHCLGLQRLTPREVILQAGHPYSGQIKLKYRGMEIVFQPDAAEVSFPAGQSVTVTGIGPHRISLT